MLRNGNDPERTLLRWPGGDCRLAAPLRVSCRADTLPAVTSDDTGDDDSGFDAGGQPMLDGVIDDAQDALNDARLRLADVPAEYVVANHVMGLYELAAIHLSTDPPSLPQAALAIDAVGCLVDGLGARLGPDAETLRSALANIRIAFVQIKGSGPAV